MTTLFNFAFYTIALIGAALSLVLMIEGETVNGVILLSTMALVSVFHAAANQ